MPRVPYLSDQSIDELSDGLIKSIKKRRPNSQLLNLDRILLYSEPVTIGWQTLFGKLREELTFSGQLRELIILRIAILNRAHYEFVQHFPVALQEGVPQAKIDAIASWQDSTLFTKEEQAILSYTDAMTKSVQVPDDVYHTISTLFNEKQIIEITALIAGYNMVSRFLEALQISAEGEKT